VDSGRFWVLRFGLMVKGGPWMRLQGALKHAHTTSREAEFLSLAFQLKNVEGYPVLNVKVVFPYIIQQFLKFPVEFFDLFTR
jgi:hypothetical protein